jgi:glutamyl-tRNA synthetase
MYDKHCRNLSVDEVKQKLASSEPRVVRMKVPENTKIITQDLIRGEIVFDSNTVDDQVILKSDGFPTYHLAVVVDDHLMGITHMVRGEEWITSSPKQYLLYDFFGWEKPAFFHSPLLRNPDKTKFSKRHGHTSVSWYQENGFLPEAIINFMALMGWSHPEAKEVFSLEEFIKLFDLKYVKPVGPVFDLKKLEWMNGQYIMKSDVRSLKSRVFEFYKGQLPEDIIEKTIPLVRERIKTLAEYLPLCEFLFKRPETHEVDLSPHKDILKKVSESLSNVEEWKADKIGEAMLKTAQELGVKNSLFFMVIRVAITGKKISPPLNESMEILGKEECLGRLESVKPVQPV